MSDGFERFLRNAADIVRERDAAAQRSRDAVAAAAKAKTEEREKLQARWELARTSLLSVVAQINAALGAVDVELRVSEEANVNPALAALSIGIYRHKEFKGHSLGLKVNGVGGQQAFVHPGNSDIRITLPHIDNCGGAQYAQMLETFVDQALRTL